MATRGEKKKDARPDGQIRQSQMVTTFGPGSMVDLVDRAVVVGGLEHWGYGREGYRSLDDPRLRHALIPRLQALNPNLDLANEGYFRVAPECEIRDPFPTIGVRSLEFPRWFVCQKCRRLAVANDAFEYKRNRYRHVCEKNKSGHAAVPVRFVAACERGHLSDFPWIRFAHGDTHCERAELYLREGATGDVANIVVECKTCQARQPMSHAAVLYQCSGERPWLGGRAVNESCDKRMKLLVRTASNAYFAQVVSALRLPARERSDLARRLREPEVWRAVEKVRQIEQLQTLVELIDAVRGAVGEASLVEVLREIERERSTGKETKQPPLRTAEYQRFLDAPEELPGELAKERAEFVAFRIPNERADLPAGVRRLVIVPELREVRVQVSFSRFDSVNANLQGEYDYDDKEVQPTVLTLPEGNEKWLPAAEVRGEGLFFELDPEAVDEWVNRPAVRERAERLAGAHAADDRGGSFLGERYFLLHSIAHLLLTAISLECGYAASSIRERIYCTEPDFAGEGMAGILLSTGTTGSEGTLGGLVEEGRRLRHHLRQAWDLGRLCSNDPVCAAHNPVAETDDRRSEGAACHGCLYVAECSCERFNRHLDRALVVPTIGNPHELAFFRERP